MSADVEIDRLLPFIDADLDLCRACVGAVHIVFIFIHVTVCSYYSAHPVIKRLLV